MRPGIFVGCLVPSRASPTSACSPRARRVQPVWVVLLALVVSAPLSFVLLRKQRDAMSAQIVRAGGRCEGEAGGEPRQEDEADDAARARPAVTAPRSASSRVEPPQHRDAARTGAVALSGPAKRASAAVSQSAPLRFPKEKC